ncbi:MAG TPA: hypothetical protein VMH87_13555 [Pseudomonadales bacterium]|nr:hypothetical protein [Pseudomonadales bacterium]
MAELMIYFFAREYSGTLDTVLFGVAIFGAIALGIFAKRAFMAFCGAAALAAPAIAYSMGGYGLLEMGGFLHALVLGGIGSVAHKLAHGFSISPPEKNRVGCKFENFLDSSSGKF